MDVLNRFGLRANVPDVLEALAGLALAGDAAEEARALLQQAATARVEFEIPVPLCDQDGYEAVCSAAGFGPQDRSGVNPDAPRP